MGCRWSQVQILPPRPTFALAGGQNRRDYRKLVVLDGRTAFLGGHCIKDQWPGEAQDREHFRDLSVRLRGPVVQSIQSTFSEILHLVICLVRKQILIQNPYFLPMPEAIEALGRAVARGVDVRVMVPATGASDMPMVQHAAHRNFSALLRAGVRIFEYQKTLLHQKVITVDGVWCAIGSSNFDDRSFEINDEISVGFYDAELAARLKEVFQRDARDCQELGLESWEKRGLWHRLQDKAFYLLKEQL
jgi:cardiolipin synthase